MLEWVSLSPFFATKATTWIRKSTFVIQISNHLQFPWWKPKQNPHIQACHEYFSVNSASNTVREAQRWCPACISMHWGRGKSLLLDLNLYHTYLSVSVKTPQIWIQIVPKEETWLQLMFQISIVCCKWQRYHHRRLKTRDQICLWAIQLAGLCTDHCQQTGKSDQLYYIMDPWWNLKDQYLPVSTFHKEVFLLKRSPFWLHRDWKTVSH